MNNFFKSASRTIAALFVSVLLASCGGGGGGGSTSGADTTPPTVSSTSPASAATDVAVNAAITATFSENMTAATLTNTTFTLSNGVTGTVTYSGTTATFTPSSNLAYSTAYTATISTGAKDAAGNALAANKTWTFTTGIAPDTTPPTITATSPASAATGIAVNAAITATFSENMDAATISTATFTLDNGVTGTVTYMGTTATFTPSSNLAYWTAYTATISTGAKDAAGNALAANKTWTFTTKPAAPLNDTGITSSQCYQVGSDVLFACNGTAPLALNSAQDGMVGRDADAANNNAADGKLGFSFTAVTGGCVQDNVTGLMWEVKTTDGGLRDIAKTYTNYDNTAAAQIWNGSVYVNPTQAEIDAATNTVGYITAVNASNLCGYSDWRLPSADELQSIVDYGVALPSTTIDTTWFPNTQGNFFWSSSPYVGSTSLAWYVYFGYGSVDNGPRVSSGYVRLVRAGQ